MSKKYKINSIPVDTLILVSKVYGIKDTISRIYNQLKLIKLHNRQIKYLIKLQKLEKYINYYEDYKDKEKELYSLLLDDLKNIPLTHIEEYRALIYLLKGLIANLKEDKK